MKVSHFLLYPSIDPKYGGPTFSVPAQCIGTQRLGVDMSMILYEASRPYTASLEKEGVNLIFLPDAKSKLQSTFDIPLWNYFKETNVLPDILHFHGVWLPRNYYISRFGQRHSIPYVINPRGDTEITRLNYNKIKKIKKKLIWDIYSKDIVNQAACMIATSEQEYESIRILGGKCPVAIIPNGIDINVFPKEISHNHGDKKIVLFLSRINPIKGLEFLLQAWSKLDPNIRRVWELHIAGNSDPREYLHSLEVQVNNLNISDSVRFIGPITGEEKMRKYQDVNLFILPTLNENFGNVIAEAMMCECPVITTTNAPWHSLIEDKCGWWINLTIDNIVNTLIEAMSLSDQERHDLGKKSRQSIIDRYADYTVAQKTYELYRWILKKENKPEFVKLI